MNKKNTDPVNVVRQLIERAFESVQTALPENLADDAKANIKTAIANTLNEMNVVTREELEAQNKVLAKTRTELEELKLLVDKLENQKSV